MTTYHILILALVQGITEFLPISSSGHLILTSEILGWPDQGLLIDVSVHVGTLVAVVMYFWRDMWEMTVGLFRMLRGRSTPGGRLALLIILATIPVVVVGFLAKPVVETAFRNAEIIAWATLGFGIVLWVSDRIGMTVHRIEHMRWGNALFIGLMQVLALIPGTSRSGITMTAARFLGMERPDAARFSMLLSIPTILGAGVLGGIDLYKTGDLVLGREALIGASFSFITAVFAIWGLMRWLRHSGFGPFVLYRIAMAAGLIYWVYA